MKTNSVFLKSKNIIKTSLVLLPLLATTAGCGKDAKTKAIEAKTAQIKADMVKQFGKGMPSGSLSLWGAAATSSQITTEMQYGKSVDGTTPPGGDSLTFRIGMTPLYYPVYFDSTRAYTNKIVAINCDPQELQLSTSDMGQLTSISPVQGKIPVPSTYTFYNVTERLQFRLIQADHIYICGSMQFLGTPDNDGLELSAPVITLQNLNLTLSDINDIPTIRFETEQLEIIGNNLIQQTLRTENVFGALPPRSEESIMKLDIQVSKDPSSFDKENGPDIGNIISGDGHLTIKMTGPSKIAKDE